MYFENRLKSNNQIDGLIILQQLYYSINYSPDVTKDTKTQNKLNTFKRIQLLSMKFRSIYETPVINLY